MQLFPFLIENVAVLLAESRLRDFTIGWRISVCPIRVGQFVGRTKNSISGTSRPPIVMLSASFPSAFIGLQAIPFSDIEVGSKLLRILSDKQLLLMRQ